eukprot:8565265-Heterocapsa_arctica.AAC.1
MGSGKGTHGEKGTAGEGHQGGKVSRVSGDGKVTGGGLGGHKTGKVTEPSEMAHDSGQTSKEVGRAPGARDTGNIQTQVMGQGIWESNQGRAGSSKDALTPAG